MKLIAVVALARRKKLGRHGQLRVVRRIMHGGEYSSERESRCETEVQNKIEDMPYAWERQASLADCFHFLKLIN